MRNIIRALIVDDDPAVRFTLSETLQRAGYEVAGAPSGEAALEILRDQSFDLAIVDLNLGSRVGGLRVLEGIRWRWPYMAVVILTAHGSLDSAMAAIREGVDGYLLKPAEPRVVLEAVREAIARRQVLSGPNETESRLLRSGPLALDLDKRQATIAGDVAALTPAEFDLLAHLIQNAHRAVPPKELVSVIHRCEPVSQYEARQIVKWYIHRLRAKIEPDPTHPVLVLNVRGVGYTMGSLG